MAGTGVEGINISKARRLAENFFFAPKIQVFYWFFFIFSKNLKTGYFEKDFCVFKTDIMKAGPQPGAWIFFKSLGFAISRKGFYEFSIPWENVKLLATDVSSHVNFFSKRSS